MRRRDFFKVLLALPFVPKALEVVSRIRLAPAAMATRVADMNAILKELYGKVQIRDMVYRDNKLLAMVRREETRRAMLTPEQRVEEYREHRRWRVRERIKGQREMKTGYAAWRESI
jgi:Mg-chelatase subunit ChlI